MPDKVPRELTYGEKTVGLTFNPSGDERVNALKRTCADLIDGLNYDRDMTNDSEAKRMFSIAITEVQTAQMWAVKGLTWGK